MKKNFLFILLITTLTVTGCSGISQNSETDTDNITAVSANPSFEITSDIAEKATEEDTEKLNSDSITIREEYQLYYDKYYELIKNYSDINQPEAILLKMNNIFNEKYKEYDQTVAYEADDLTQTMYNNFITPDEKVLKYDPLALAFYNNHTNLKANPILTAEKADEKLIGKFSSTEYMPFSYNIKPVEINKDFSVPSKALAEIVEEYFDISNTIVGYSPDEELYYTYIINANGKENSFTITTLFLDIDKKTHEIKRTGIETYVRTHSEINTYFNKNTTPYAMETCVTDCLNTSYLASPYNPNNPIGSISEDIIAQEHKDLSDIMGTLMQSNTSFSQTNSVKFKLVDDFPSSMNTCPHFHSAHYVSWFTKN